MHPSLHPWPPSSPVDYHTFQTISASLYIGSHPRLPLLIAKRITYIYIQHTHGQHRTRYSISHQELLKTTSKRDVCRFYLSVDSSGSLTTSLFNLNEDYDLVRIHHPDSVHSRLLSPSVRHARFQSITSAYDILRGKSQNSPHSGVDPYSSEVHRRKHFYQAHHDRRAEYAYPGREWTASPDDRWKDRVIIIVGLVVSTLKYSHLLVTVWCLSFWL